ncbi:MAG: alcohol dehydrogenase catalytic domain-containing protein [Anaerolineae bacterium]
MKAIRLVEIGRPLQAIELPLPTLGVCDALVRVHAAGICHSDVHYRSGTSYAGPLPLTPGHEVAGVVAAVGAEARNVRPGDRVCLHYLVTCGDCSACRSGREQFCAHGRMIGKHCDGGYAEFVAVPARCCLPLPEEIPFAQGAIMMCSSATALHALRKGRLQPGERVAVFGVGGLGMSAVQLARALGALDVYAVDINPVKLQLAAAYGAVPVDASTMDPVAEIIRLTGGGVDVALELIGLPLTMRQAVQSVGACGRAVLVGITTRPLELDSYHELLGKEAEVIGSNDHLLPELELLLELARRGRLDLSRVVTGTVPLEASAINDALDGLERFAGDVRTVIVPA